ncbi:hypothetical protein DFQ26_002979, partial [Actinomortierella ambigua]
GLDNLWVASVDLGVVVTAAVSVRVPPSQLPPPAVNQQPPANPLPSPPDHTMHGNLMMVPRASQQSAAYRNLTIKQKALYQPVFRFRHDLETRKTEEVRQAESSILARRG